MDVDFTAQMEKSLDEVESGQHPYLDLLKEFYGGFQKTLKSAESNMVNLKAGGLETDLRCPKCDRPLRIRYSRNGPYVTCSGYPECTFSSDYERDEKGRVQLAATPSTGETCEKCGRPMVLKKAGSGRSWPAAVYPECKNTRAPRTGIPCPSEGCEGELVERVSKSGRHFFGCNRYPACKMVFSGRPVSRSCPLCGSKVLVEKQGGKAGARLVCPNPSCKYSEKVESGAAREAAKE